MSMSMRETLQNTNSRDDVMRAMQNSFARPNAAVGQSGLQFFELGVIYSKVPNKRVDQISV